MNKAVDASFREVVALKKELLFVPLHKSKPFQELLSRLSTEKAP